MERVGSKLSEPMVSRETPSAPTVALMDQRRLITMHNDKGQSIFDKSRSVKVPTTVLPSGTTFGLCYATDTSPVEMNSNSDMKAYDGFLHQSTSLGLTIHNGTVLRHVDLLPSRMSTMHRTTSIDYGVVIVGEVDLLLDSGETERLCTGDIAVQRGTMHAWRNPSDTNVARILFVLVDALPLEVRGMILEEELGDLPIRGSSHGRE